MASRGPCSTTVVISGPPTRPHEKGTGGLKAHLERLCKEAVQAASDGCEVIILSDEAASKEEARVGSAWGGSSGRGHVWGAMELLRRAGQGGRRRGPEARRGGAQASTGIAFRPELLLERNCLMGPGVGRASAPPSPRADKTRHCGVKRCWWECPSKSGLRP